MSYAEATKVSTENSRMEIERTLRRYKADAFAYGHDGDIATVMFRMSGRMVKFILKLPDQKDEAFTCYYRGSVKYRRDDGPAEEKWEQACRQKWRALALVIKAKLEAVEAGITTVEDEFLAHTVLPDGSTVGDWARPQIDQVYLDGKMPPLLLGAPS